MADNTTINAGTGGDVIATDELTTLNGGAVSGVKAQRVKVGYGSDGSFRDVDGANGLPVQGLQDARITGSIAVLNGAVTANVSNRNVLTVDISGTYVGVTVNFEGSPDGTNWFPVQGMNNGVGTVASIVALLANQSVSWDFAVGGFTQFRVRASAFTSGSVAVGVSPQVFAYEPVVAAIVTPPPRTQVSYFATGAAAGATGVETLINLTKSPNIGGATSATTSHAVPAGKTLRITSITFGSRGSATATAQVTTFTIRVNTAGAAVTTSNPILAARTATPATALAWDRFSVPLPDGGIEIPGNGTLNFAVSANAVFTTNAPTWDVTITGYEY